MKFQERIKDSSFWIVFLLIYFSQDALVFGTNANRLFFLIKNIFMVAFLIYILRKPTLNSGYSSKNAGVTLVGLVAMSMLSAMFNADLTLKYFYEILLFFIAYNVTRVITFAKFKEQFVYSIYYLSLLSVAVYFISLFAYPILEVLPALKNESGFLYYSLGGLVNISERPMYGIIRNASLFREPGMYAIFLIMGLIFLFNTDTIGAKQKNIIFAVLSVAVFTTLSTAGYIGLIILLVYLIIGKNKQIATSSKLVLLLIAAAGFYFLISNESIVSSVFDKMSGNNASADSRFGAIYNNIEMWQRSLVSMLFGNGYNFVESNIDAIAMRNGYVAGDNTNTFFKMLSVHGIFYFITVLSLLYMSCRRITSNRLSLFVFILFCVMLSNEDLIFDQILYIILFYGLTARERYEVNSANRLSAA